MDRRNFFKMMVGGVAATAVVRTWPFRVYSFPSEIKIAHWYDDLSEFDLSKVPPPWMDRRLSERIYTIGFSRYSGPTYSPDELEKLIQRDLGISVERPDALLKLDKLYGSE